MSGTSRIVHPSVPSQAALLIAPPVAIVPWPVTDETFSVVVAKSLHSFRRNGVECGLVSDAPFGPAGKSPPFANSVFNRINSRAEQTLDARGRQAL